jgi:hypothetical protein
VRMHDRHERMALNEALFRNANERIRDHAHEHGADHETIAFYCECSDRDCVERVEISGGEYEVVRSDPAQFIVLPGHLRLEVEEVVRRAPGFLVVRKIGEAAQVAVEHDPRT